MGDEAVQMGDPVGGVLASRRGRIGRGHAGRQVTGGRRSGARSRAGRYEPDCGGQLRSATMHLPRTPQGEGATLWVVDAVAFRRECLCMTLASRARWRAIRELSAWS